MLERERRWIIEGNPSPQALAAILLAVAAAPLLLQAGPQTTDERVPMAAATGGQVPNRSYPSSELFTQISPQMSDRSHQQPTVINGYLLLAGNGVHEFWDISDPYAPVRLSEMFSPHRFGQAESHQVSYAKFPDGSLYLVTISGRGIDLWGIDNVHQPSLLSALELPNINYGDIHHAVWGVAWEGDYIYVGATSNGLYIVDASNPAQPELVASIPTSEMGGVPTGPLFALGNLLVITTPKEHKGVVTMDISNPASPALLDFERPGTPSYIGSFYGRNAHLLDPFRTYDVTSDPRNIELIGSDSTPESEYMSFADGQLFLGGVHDASAGIWKYDIGDPNHLQFMGRIPSRDIAVVDDQFSVAIGNLIAISNDENIDVYGGSFLAVHATQPDTQPPVVEYANPPDGAVEQALSSRVALSFSDQIEFASVDSSTLIVRPIGGQALTGKWGHTQTVVTFWPDQPLQPDTGYEIVAVAGGITDLVGNALANEFRSAFRTGTASIPQVGGIAPLSAVATGQNADFVARPTPGSQQYRWDFGDGHQASGAEVSHAYDAPGRYPVTLSVFGPDGRDVFEAEAAALARGAVVENMRRRYFGTGYAAYRGAPYSSSRVEWQIGRTGPGNVDIVVRYSNGSDTTLPLELVVNGTTIETVAFERTRFWGRWKLLTINDVPLNAGTNTVALIARDGIGPNLDRLSLPSETLREVASYSAVQIVHRPLTANEPSRSGTVIVTADQARAWTVNPDTDTVTAVDTGSLNKAFESKVGLAPRTLAQAPDGTIWVVNEGSYDISVVDSSNGAVIARIELPYASMPYGIAFAPDGSAAYVTLQALGQLLRIDPASRAIVQTLALGPDASGIVPKLRGIAVDADSRRILVTRFVSPDQGGEIYDVGVANRTMFLARAIALAVDPGPDATDGGRGIPNYISSLAISPDGARAWVPSKKDNIERGLNRDGLALTHENAVRTVISQIELSSGLEDLAARVDLDDHDMAFAVAFSPLGDLLFTAIQGSNAVSVIDAYSGTQVAGVATGLAPQGLTLDDQGRLYVQNFMGRSLSVFDAAALLAGTATSAPLLAEIDLVANETLADQVLRGKRIFYDASSSKMSQDGYISCASCHLDGGQDGRIWDFSDRGEGFRNTISLHGRGGTQLHGPVHWTGNFDEIQDFENDIRSHFGGSGFMSDDAFNGGTRSDPLGDPKAGLSTELDALAAYVSSLTGVLPSPYRNADGTLTAEGELGKQVFAQQGCAECHGGAQFTDSAPGVLHDVGTAGPSSGGRLGELLTGFDTPTLKGVWATAPYLHDGSASTLAEAIDAHSGVSLADSALNTLASYLQQIDELEAAAIDPMLSDATLASLSLSGIDLEFDADTTAYAVPVGNQVASTLVVAEASHERATVSILPVDPDPVEGHRVAMPVGQTIITVTVRAADGATTRTYTVTVTRVPPPEVTVAPAANPVTEGAAAEFEVRLAEAAIEALTVALSVTETGSMMSGTPPASVTLAKGDTSATLRVPTTGDRIVEADSTVTASLVSGAGYAVGTESSATVTVEDDDEATFGVSAAPLQIKEGESATLTVAITNGVTFAEDQSVSLAVSGTASASDFTVVPTELALATGASSATAELTASEDEEDEEAETVTVTASHDGSAIGSATVTITNVSHDATLSSLSLSGIDIGTFAAGTTAYSTEVAHDVASTTVVATAAHPAATVAIQPAPEVTLAEGANEVTVTVTAEDGTTTRAYTVTVTRAGPPVATIAAGTTPVAEGAAATYTVTLDRAAPEVLTVALSVTESGSVLSGTPPASVSITQGATSVTLSVPTSRDSVVEADSTVTATLIAGTGYSLGTDVVATVAVEDDDAATFTVTAEPQTVAEGESATLTVAISNEVTFAEDQTISLAASGTASASDYTGVPATLTLGAGAASVTTTLAAATDQEEEEAETVTVTATHDGSEIGSATATINSVSHDATLASLSLSGVDVGTFSGTVTAYTASVANSVTATTVTATATHSGATVSIRPGPEVALAEGANEITVTVTAEDGTTTRAYTVTVTRAGLPVATIAAGATPVTEGTPAEFTLSLDAAAPAALTVAVNVAESGSVLSGTPPSSVAFAKGATSATLSVPTAGDSVVEADGTVTATLIAGSGYSLGTDVLATVAVEDDDAATFTVTAEPQTIAEGESATLTVAISNEVTFAQDQTISLVTSGTASASDYTGLPATLTLGVGASSATALLTAAADQEEEAAETVTVTASHGGSAVGSATVTIESVSQDATLAGLSLSGIDIGVFSSTVTAYTASVAHSVTATTVRATATHSGATVSIAPGPEVPLAEGANEITVTVTAENGTTTQTYTATVTRSGLPVVSIAAVEERVSEAEMGRFRISRTGPIAEPLEVPVLFASSRSRRARTLTVRFVPGQRSVTRRVQDVDDTIVEDDVTVTWTLQAGEGYAVSGERGSASLVFEENDVPEFAVTLEPGEIAEGETATLTVAITNGVRFRAAQTITLAASGTASASDYRGLPETLRLSAYGTSPRFSTTARLRAVADREQEAAETLTVTASHGGSAVGSATVTIMSVARDATLSALSLSGIDIGRFSAATTAYRTSVAHSVTATTVTATATDPGATVSIAPGPEVALAEGANEIAVTVTAEDGTTTRTYTVTVTRSSLPVVSIVAVEERVSEAEQARFRVSRTGPASEPLEVPVHFTSTRSSEVQNLTVRFARGQRSVTERVEAGDDTIVEDDLTVTWTLQAGEGYAVSEDSVSASVVFEENDVPEFAVTLEPGEIAEGETATLTVAITNGVRFRAAQTIALAASGTATESDYRGLPETLRLSAYGTSATFSATARLRAVADREEEAAETLTVTASHGGSVIGSATVTITSVSRDATLSGLSLSGVDIGRFSAATTAYRASVAQSVTATTVTATASHSGATVAIEPGAEVALAEGANEITVTVTAEDGTTTRTYTVTVTRAGSSLTAQFLQLPATHDGQAAFTFELRFSREPDLSFRTLRDTAFEVTGGRVRKAKRVVSGSNLRWAITVEPSSEADVVLTLPVTTDCAAVGAICTAGGSKLAQAVSATVRGPQVEPAGFPLARANSRPSGVWSDGETVWVADLEDAKLYAYGRADGEREPGKDMATEPGPMGLWSDGETLWVAGLEGGLRAHRLADGARLAERDLALEGEEAPAGVWSDGETVWAAGWLGDRVRAYRLADGERLASRDIPLKGENLMPVGLWSDGETLWVADWRERLYAYRLADGGRVPQRDVEVSGTDADPTGLWSGGGTLLWTGWEGREVRAYRLPAVAGDPDPGGHGGWTDSVPMIADPGLRAAIRAALGKAPGETVSAGELAGLESLSARNFGVRDLAGLEAATGLKELDLGFNPLADLRQLALLPALESLNLDGAALDLRPLAALAGLRRLSVRHNLLDDLQPLAALGGLTELDIGDNRIEDLRPLARLARLAVLRADRNGIADLWPLASVTGLETLDLGANRIRDLQPLAGLERLRTLRLHRNRLSELHPLSGLRGLEDLGLASTAVRNLEPLAGLDGLRRLDLRGSAVRDLRPLRRLASLASVHVGGSRIRDLAPLDRLDGLAVDGRDDLEPPVAGDARLR